MHIISTFLSLKLCKDSQELQYALSDFKACNVKIVFIINNDEASEAGIEIISINIG